MSEKKLTTDGVLRGLKTRSFVGLKETWSQWLYKVSRCKSVQEMQSLLHRGFDAEVKTVEEQAERIKFYFEFVAMNPDSLTRKAYTALCTHFLSSENIVFFFRIDIIRLVKKFYTLRRAHEIKMTGFLGGEYEKKITLKFLKFFASHYGCWNMDESTLPKEELDDIHFWCVTVLYHIGEIYELFENGRYKEVSGECITALKEFALSRSESLACNFDELCLSASDEPIAQFCVLAEDYRTRMSAESA